jgi:hypothetical protein
MKKWIERLITAAGIATLVGIFLPPSRIWTHNILEEAMENDYSPVNACYCHS